MYSDFLIIIPTYNERTNIEILLEGIARFRTESSHEYQVLVVDDGSPDNTGKFINEISLSWVKLLQRERKAGLGNAYKAGFEWAIEHNFQFVIEMDADGSHRIEDLQNLLTANREIDLVLGSRWIESGRILNWPWYRRLLSLGGNSYARLALGLPIKDMTSGYRRIKVSALRRVNFRTLSTKGYGFQIEMVSQFNEFNLTIIEVPITFIERTIGQSKMTIGIAVEAWKTVTKLGLKRLR